ncbi:uncharacterized protein B0P05DRAFT_571256 [Gilbertella persicaria]|uniref:uncharacterized protein n=1 Tax=Gilbertella persicaria TaxID=101096 RepID=UPI0022209652|nr:uncharacterized protein B0P05DRAFT_571256 [Gilbertella persicaria]KAI8080107.1 hypothetical protein B0P05DRAFT_571256 [Gilbertella persicaria]
MPASSSHVNEPSLETSSDILSIDKNEDYQHVLKVLQILKSQQTKASKDIDTLHQLKSEALKDPYGFLLDLNKKPRHHMPKLQKVVAVPPIDWGKYRFLPESRLAQETSTLCDLTQKYMNQRKPTFCNILDIQTQPETGSSPATPTLAKSLQHELQKATQAMRQIPSRAASVSDGSEDEDTESVATKTTPPSTGKSYGRKGKGKRRTSMAQTGKDLQASAMDMSETESPTVSRLQSIEPRTSDEDGFTETNETPSFNQPWTDEEQARLQELLVVFPDEPIQAQRFNKISKALGTRTPRQVASRVQKYFIKLAKMGLPVPGRFSIPPSCQPKEKDQRSKPKSKKSGRITKPSAPSLRTSGAGYNSLLSGGITNTRISGAHYTTSHGPPAAFMSDDEDMNVKEMMRTVNTKLEANDLVIHEGYACDGCGTEPIVGVRYKCTVCDVSEQVDLCGQCMEKGTFTNALYLSLIRSSYTRPSI